MKTFPFDKCYLNKNKLHLNNLYLYIFSVAQRVHAIFTNHFQKGLQLSIFTNIQENSSSMSGLCCSLMEPLVLFWRSLLLLDGQTSKYFLSKLSFTVLQVSLSHEYGCDMKPSSASSSLDIRLCADLDFNSCVTIFFFSIPQFFFSAAWSRRRTFYNMNNDINTQQ